MNANTEPIQTDGEKAISDNYMKMYDELVKNKGFSPRKARRYLDSIAKRNIKKFNRKVKGKQVLVDEQGNKVMDVEGFMNTPEKTKNRPY